MKKQQSGFTLIELIMVIVVLGALAVTALPRYIDLEAQAQKGAADGIAGALASASAINFADCTANSASATCIDNVPVGAMNACDDLAGLLVGAALPTGYSLDATELLVSGSAVDCTLTGPGTPATTSIFKGLAP